MNKGEGIIDFINRVFHDDCYSVLFDFPDNTFDAIITDPPYNASIQGREVHLKDRNYASIRAEWDRGYDVKWIKGAIRLLKEEGSLLVFCSHHLLGTYLSFFQEIPSLYLRQVLHWHKTNPIYSVRKYYTFSIEYILWLTKGSNQNYTFHREAVKQFTGINSQFLGHDVFFYPLCGGNERWNHGTQKPLKLMEALVSIHTNPDDLILDPFGGTGTTAVAAKKLGRNYTLIEKEPEYIEIIQERLRQEYLF